MCNKLLYYNIYNNRAKDAFADAVLIDTAINFYKLLSGYWLFGTNANR